MVNISDYIILGACLLSIVLSLISIYTVKKKKHTTHTLHPRPLTKEERKELEEFFEQIQESSNGSIRIAGWDFGDSSLWEPEQNK